MKDIIICPECKGSDIILDTGGITGKFKCKSCGYVGIMPSIEGNFRYFFTSNGFLVLAGKNAKQNEEIVKIAKADEFLLHTKSPGSPFCLIKGKPKEKDLREAANFCACFSKEWKIGKGKIEVDVFLKKDVYKSKNMAIGMFGIKKIWRRITLKPRLFVNLVNGKIEILPYRKKIIATIERGKKERDDVIKEIYEFAKRKKYEIGFVVLPAHNLDIKWKN
jgi:hypothetical protein